MSRRFLFVPLALSLCLGGCGVATRVQSAFQMPVAAPARAQSNPNAHQAPELDSLSRSLRKLDRTTFDTLIKRWQTPAAKTSASTPKRPAFLPSSWAVPALFQAPKPVPSPLVFPARGRDLPFSAPPLAPEVETQSGAAPLEFILPRTMTAPSPPSGGAGTDGDLRAFLSGWAARQSLARADEEFLERRALNERIALLSRAAIPGVDLSLVPPEVQLELTNLRLELLPLLSSSPGQKARAQNRINAIEARLRQIWEAETARQARVRRQALEEAPARLGREGEAALGLATRNQARFDQEQRARVRDAHSQGRPSVLPALSVRQNGTLAPDAKRVRALLQTPFTPSAPSFNAGIIAPLSLDNAPLSIVRNGVSSGSVARRFEQQARVWRAATR